MAESQFGKFTLVRKIASGGMGEVFLARQRGPEGFEKFLVVKRILSHHTDNADYVDMFFAEARLAAKMSHSNIVQIFDMGEIEGSYYIAMEFVHGKSIKDIIDQARTKGVPIPPAHTADIVGRLCAGMAYAHSLVDESGQLFNIIHRDINPHNVLVSYSGEAKIIDFGIAKSEMNEHKTETGTIKGKFVYMSPEQSAAEKIDKRSDIFSIGIVLYEMLAGENPFQKANIVLSLDAIQRFNPPPPSSINPAFKAFDPIVEKALAKKADERYQDASEMQQALQRAVILGDIGAAPKPLNQYMHELFKESIERDQQYMKDSRREIANTPIGELTPRPRTAPTGHTGGVRPPPPEPTHTPPPTPLPIHQTGSRSGVTAIRKKRRRTVLGIVVSLMLITAVSVAGILMLARGGSKTTVTTTVVETPVPTFVAPTAPAPATAPSLPTPTPQPSAIAAPPPPTPSAVVQAPEPEPKKGVQPAKSNKNDKPSKRGKNDVVVESPVVVEKNEDKTPQKTTVIISPSQPDPTPQPVKPAPQPPQQQFGGYFLVNSTPPAAVQQNGSSLGIAVAQGVKVDVRGATGAIKVGDAGSPFQVTLQYRMTGPGQADISVDSAPWSILKKNGIAVGKTPRPGIAADTKPMRFEFASPAVPGGMTVVVRYFPN